MGMVMERFDSCSINCRKLLPRSSYVCHQQSQRVSKQPVELKMLLRATQSVIDGVDRVENLMTLTCSPKTFS